MIPWPIALLALFYGAIATMAGAMFWKHATGISAGSIAWPMVWLILSVGAAFGLALLRPWGRTLAMWTSALLSLATVAAAGWLVALGHPGAGLCISLATSIHILMIRYLQRPVVKGWFEKAALSTKH